VSVVEYLLQHGADVHAKDKGQVPTIAMASFPLSDLFRKIWKNIFLNIKLWLVQRKRPSDSPHDVQSSVGHIP